MSNASKPHVAEICRFTPEMPEGMIWKGNPTLIPLLVPIKSLHEDPANANTHPERSVATIAASYARFGQQKPIVIAKDRTVRDGNGQLRAGVERLGWTHIAVVSSDLEGVELTAYAIAANRTAEHAAWDDDVLAETLASIQAEDIDLAIATGFTNEEINALVTQFSPNIDNSANAEAIQDSLPTGDKPNIVKLTFTLTDQQAQRVTAAITAAKMEGPFSDTESQNSNGNALDRIAEHYLADTLS